NVYHPLLRPATKLGSSCVRIERLLHGGRVKMGADSISFRKGEFIFKEGDEADCLFLVRTGVISLRKKKEGGYVELGRAHSNQVFGELSFFDKEARSASAVALSEVEVLKITFESLESILKKTPSFMKAIMGGMAERLRAADDIVKTLK